MQNAFANTPNWLQLALTAVAALLSGVGIDKLYNSWLNRKKPTAEVHLTEATATEVTVRASSSAGDAVIRMMARLEEAQLNIDRLRTERDAWQDQYDQTFIENVRLKGEVKVYGEQVKRMRITLESNNLNYDNTQDVPLTPPRE